MEELTFVIDIKKSGDSCKKFDGVKKYIATADIIYDEIVGYTEVTYDNKPSRANVVAKPGDVLFAKMQNTIKVIVVDEETCNYIYSTGFYCISDERFLPKFLKCYFMSKNFNDKKDKNCNGATMKALSDEGFKKIKLPLIPKEIQQRIIDEYIALSASIKNKKNQINVFDELIKSQFIEMFGDSNNSKGYPIIQVGDYCDKIQVGIVIKPSKYYVQNGGVKSFRSLNVGELYVKDENWVEISLEGNRENSKSILNENDVVIVRSGNPGTSCVIPKKYSGYNAIDLIIARVNQNLCNSYYLSSFTNFEHGMKQIKEGTGGAAQQHFNVSKYSKMKIFDVEKKYQDQFAAIVEQIDKSKFINKMSLILQF